MFTLSPLFFWGAAAAAAAVVAAALVSATAAACAGANECLWLASACEGQKGGCFRRLGDLLAARQWAGQSPLG